MDEELKIIIPAELDESESAQRIKNQLPNLAKLINSQSSIKVRVSLDESTIHTQTQKLAQQITQVTKTHGIGVTLSLDQSSVNKIRTELNNLRVNPDISRVMTDQLDQMGIQIDKISGRWETVNGQQERMLNLTIQGTDQMGRTVTYLQTYDVETGKINTNLTNVTANLERQRNVQEQIAKQAKADNEARVSYLIKQRAILDEIQSVYTGATSAKPVTSDSHLTALNSAYDAINAQIQTMMANEGKLGSIQRSSIETQIAGLKRMVKEYQNAEYVATKLRTKDIGTIKSDQLSGLDALEKRLEAAGTLTDAFRQKIDSLRISLDGVSNKDQLVSFLNSFDQLNNDVSVFQERLRGVNNIYTQLIALDKQIVSVQSSMVKLDPEMDKDRLVALQGQQAVLNNQKASLEAQLAPYSDITQYAKQATALEQSRLINGSKLVEIQMELADKARKYDADMQRVPATIKDLEAKYRQVAEPTETLVRNMKRLREIESQYSSNMSDQEKLHTYERLQRVISACRQEMSELTRVQRADVSDFKFTQGLEKAKADLATIGRTWSALKGDPGLNAQFQQLSENLKLVNNQADLTKWRAQFSAFKSEVKAAGKNVQSLGDIFKNNLSKVLQWVSATTILFRAFRLLKSAVSTIVDLDTAMVDLLKVTSATEEEYRKFYASANDTAKALGVTTEAVISQTAEWARLGYAMQDAAKLSENSAIFAAISPGMDITQATDGLVSVLKAFDEIGVNNSLDGIISKVNDIGNKFAVSNKDIVEVMTRSSAAMKAANNTFEETVALATAAVEITRDPASVGNAMKTVSMRIRGYDEELEEYSNDIVELTGDIADLTKVASNNFKGVSLFEVGDPETYRSTYDILADIADIWDELTDKSQAKLLETLFGKRQGQIGAAILSNFEQAQKAMETMENSAGSAEREMEKITNSLEYKLNALKETWVGVAQNLFQSDNLKVIVDILIGVSSAVDQLTKSFGLLGTVGLAAAIPTIMKFKSLMGSFRTTVLPVVDAIRASGQTMDGSANSIQFYASKLMTLDKYQRAAAMSALGLTQKQKDQVVGMTNLIVSSQKYTIQTLAEKATTDEAAASFLANSMAKATEKNTTDQLSASMMVEILSSNELTEAQKRAIIATLEQTAANDTLGASYDSLTAKQKLAVAASSISPMMWVSIALSTIPIVISLFGRLYNWIDSTADRANEAAEQARNDLNETRQELESVNTELQTTRDRLNELLNESENRTLTIVEQEELDNLREELRLLEQREFFLKRQEQRRSDEADEKTVAAFNKGTGSNKFSNLDLFAVEAMQQERLALDQFRDSWTQVEKDRYAELSDLIREYSQARVNGLDIVSGLSTGQSMEYGKYIDLLIDRYKALNEELSKSDDLTDSQIAVKRNEIALIADELDQIGESMLESVDALQGDSEYKDIWQKYVDEIDMVIHRSEAFKSQLSLLTNGQTEELSRLAEQGELTAQAVEKVVGKAADGSLDGITFSAQEVADYFNSLVVSADGASEAVARQEVALGDLKDVISDMGEAYDVVEAAQEEMNETGSISSETLEKMAEVSDDYLSYLYEEDGKLKLNIELWRERAEAQAAQKILDLTDEIAALEKENEKLREQRSFEIGGEEKYDTQILSNEGRIEQDRAALSVLNATLKELSDNVGGYSESMNLLSDERIADIQEENAELEVQGEKLRENLAFYERQQSMQVAGTDWGSLIADTTAQLDKNTQALKRNAAVIQEWQVYATASEQTSLSTGEAIEQLSAAESNIEQLSKALGELQEEGAISSSTLESLYKTFGNTSGFQEFVDTISRSGLSMEEAQAACNALAAQMGEYQTLLAGVTQENASLIESMLTAQGVTNAHELVQAQLNAELLEAKVATAGLKDAKWEEVEAFLQSTDATNSDIEALRLLRAEQYNATLAATDFSNANEGVISSLLRQAQAAGAAASSIRALQQIQKFKDMGWEKARDLGYTRNEYEFDYYLDQLSKQVEKINLDDIEVKIPDVKVSVSVPEQKSGGSGSKAAKEKKENQEKEKKDTTSSDVAQSVTKAVEKYVVEIDKFAEAVEKLRRATENVSEITYKLDMTDDLRQKYSMQDDYIKGLQDEQAALNNVTEQRSEYISQQVDALRKSGFDVEYSEAKNGFFVHNKDLLNQMSLQDLMAAYGRIDPTYEKLPESMGDVKTSLDNLNDTTKLSTQKIMEIVSKVNSATGESFTYEDALYGSAGPYSSKLGNYLGQNVGVTRTPEQERQFAAWKDELEKFNGDMLSAKRVTEVYTALRCGVEQENELRKQMESIINELEGYDKENQQNTDQFLEDNKKIREAMKERINLLAQITEESSNAVDNIQGVLDTLSGAAEEFENSGGYLTLDTYQSILKLGPQYMQYLTDENGLWVINKQAIQDVIAAKADQLVLDTAWTYVERLKLAMQEDSVEDLNELLFATNAAAEGSWDLVYANLALLDLDNDQYEAALHNINAMRDLTCAAIDGIGQVSDSAKDSLDGVGDILDYVMDMLKQRVQDQIDAIEEMKDAYGELIDKKKESLEAEKKEMEYGQKRAKQLKEMAKLQARIDMLSLDDSREAQAERKKLLEEMASMQENLSETQSDYAVDNQKDALDEMKDAYEKEKDDEIKELEDSISSQQKLYEKAIDYIKGYGEDRWDELKSELLQWNYDVGNDLEENIVSAWDECIKAAQRYGSIVEAIQVSKQEDTPSSTGGNAVANSVAANQRMAQKLIGQMKQNSLDYYASSNKGSLHRENVRLAEQVSNLLGRKVVGGSSGGWKFQDTGEYLYSLTQKDLVDQMKKNSGEWHKADSSRKKLLESANNNIASIIEQLFGTKLYYRAGEWFLQDGSRLYEKYHTGGVVGAGADWKDKEVLAKLEKGETVLTDRMWENAVSCVEKMSGMMKALGNMDIFEWFPSRSFMQNFDALRAGNVTNITNDTRPVEISFGDTIINGAAQNAIEKHREISREMINEIARQIRKP